MRRITARPLVFIGDEVAITALPPTLRSVTMCEKCADIDERIAHYERIAHSITDKVTLDRILELIIKLDAEKAALHSEQ